MDRPSRSSSGPSPPKFPHSPSLEFQREMLPRLEQAARNGEIPAADVAMLTDRVLVNGGLPQRYGNSFELAGDRMVPHPIEDVTKLDSLRAAVGLPPMSEYVRLLAGMYRSPVDWPPGPRDVDAIERVAYRDKPPIARLTGI